MQEGGAAGECRKMSEHHPPGRDCWARTGISCASVFAGAIENERHELHEAAMERAPQCLRFSLEHFARGLFPEHCRLEFSRMHRELFGLRESKMLPVTSRRGALDMILAPRGAAKSTLVSLIFPIHAMVHGIDPYIVLISATQRQASTRVDNIRRAIIHNARLRRHFPEAVKSLERSSRSTVVMNECRLDAFSAGTEIRGVTHGEWRPTWIILDDVESSARILNSGYRDRMTDWMREVIEYLGDGCTNVDLVGTLLHTDALPMRMARRPDARLRIFRSILRECDRPNLWEPWLKLLHDLADPDRMATARAYYDRRAFDMRRGAEVLWEAKEDYHDLQIQRATRGSRAFNQEKQNEPADESESYFPSSILRRFGPGEEPPRAQRLVFGFLDPALGTRGRSGGSADYSTIVTVALAPATGGLFVLDVWMERCGPSGYVPMIFDLHARFDYHRFGIETNTFQELLLDLVEQERTRRKNRGEPWRCEIERVRHFTPKNLRIQRIEPLVRMGQLRFAGHLPEPFIRQLTEYPHGRHDDGPDALAATVRLALDHADRTRPVLPQRVERIVPPY